MTELTANETASNKRTGLGRSKHHSPRIDMTPMADLGFLLITFFIFTSRLTEPTVLNMVMRVVKKKFE